MERLEEKRREEKDGTWQMLTAQRIDLTTAAQAASAMAMASNCLLSAASAVASQQLLLFPLALPLREAQNLSVVLRGTGAPGRGKSKNKLVEHAASDAGRQSEGKGSELTDLRRCIEGRRERQGGGGGGGS